MFKEFQNFIARGSHGYGRGYYHGRGVYGDREIYGR